MHFQGPICVGMGHATFLFLYHRFVRVQSKDTKITFQSKKKGAYLYTINGLRMIWKCAYKTTIFKFDFHRLSWPSSFWCKVFLLPTTTSIPWSLISAHPAKLIIIRVISIFPGFSYSATSFCKSRKTFPFLNNFPSFVGQ